jgi:hypothetical protein
MRRVARSLGTFGGSIHEQMGFVVCNTRSTDSKVARSTQWHGTTLFARSMDCRFVPLSSEVIMNSRIWIAPMALAMALGLPQVGLAQSSETVSAQVIASPGPVSPYASPGREPLAALIIDQFNGFAVSNPTGGSGGAPISTLTAPDNSFGSSMNFTGNLWLAAPFTVAAPGLTINRVRFYGYQTGSTTTSTMNSLRVRIYSTSLTTPPIYGDATTNVLSTTTFTGIYRVQSTTLTNTTRPIMELVGNLGTPAVLTPGSYFVSWSATGTLASGPFSPPQVVNSTHSCQQSADSGTTFAPVIDAGSTIQVGCLFILEGVTSPVTLQNFDVE